MHEALPRDADATRRRLLDAARAEFARVGIAGARVDRIAAEARSNKAQIYHYFGSKDRLFDAVFEDVVAAVLAEVPLDASDLPAYAARLHDGYVSHPEIGRIATWYRLERGESSPLIQAIVDSNRSKVAAIKAAQDAGKVADKFPATVLLGLVIHLAATWAQQTPEYLALISELGEAQRRSWISTAVDRLANAGD